MKARPKALTHSRRRHQERQQEQSRKASEVDERSLWRISSVIFSVGRQMVRRLAEAQFRFHKLSDGANEGYRNFDKAVRLKLSGSCPSLIFLPQIYTRHTFREAWSLRAWLMRNAAMQSHCYSEDSYSLSSHALTMIALLSLSSL